MAALCQSQFTCEPNTSINTQSSPLCREAYPEALPPLQPTNLRRGLQPTPTSPLKSPANIDPNPGVVANLEPELNPSATDQFQP
jgi:hypothetical protein